MKVLFFKNPYSMSSIFGEPSEDYVSIKVFFRFSVHWRPLEGLLSIENL